MSYTIKPKQLLSIINYLYYSYMRLYKTLIHGITQRFPTWGTSDNLKRYTKKNWVVVEKC